MRSAWVTFIFLLLSLGATLLIPVLVGQRPRATTTTTTATSTTTTTTTVTTTTPPPTVLPERCDCVNPTVNASYQFDVSDLVGATRFFSCGNPLALPNGNLAIYAGIELAPYFFLRIYTPDGVLVSSTPIDYTGSGQWTSNDCDPTAQYSVLSGNYIYIMGYNFGGSALGVGLARFFLDGTIDTSFGLNGFVNFRLGEGAPLNVFPQAMAGNDDAFFIAGYYRNATNTYGCYRKYFGISGALDINFGVGGEICLPYGATCLGNFPDAYGTMIYDPDFSRLLFVLRNFVGALNTDTGLLDTTYGSGGCFAFPNVRGWPGAALSANHTSAWATYVNPSPSSTVRVDINGTAAIQSALLSGPAVTRFVAPFCSQNFVETDYVSSVYQLRTRDFETLATISETTTFSFPIIAGTLVYSKDARSFYMFPNQNSPDLRSVRIQCN